MKNVLHNIKDNWGDWLHKVWKSSSILFWRYGDLNSENCQTMWVAKPMWADLYISDGNIIFFRSILNFHSWWLFKIYSNLFTHWHFLKMKIIDYNRKQCHVNNLITWHIFNCELWSKWGNATTFGDSKYTTSYAGDKTRPITNV